MALFSRQPSFEQRLKDIHIPMLVDMGDGARPALDANFATGPSTHEGESK